MKAIQEPRPGMDRRTALKAGSSMTVLGLAIAAGLIPAREALAQAAGWNKAAFDTKTLADLVRSLGGSAPSENTGVQFVAPTPEIAENGAVVPVGVTSSLPKTEMIAILVEKNPNILTARFNIVEGADAFVSTRVKMGQTSDVYALVKADGKFYFAKKEIKVTLGGCGG